ncbi:MAG: SNF2-related protein [Euryarchaeota archaeon]|nr:SNF2-related protein [Euryarchaeota archaeon]
MLQKPDEGNLQVRFCEGAHSNLGAITPERGALCALLDKARRATSERLEDVELIVVDESHNLRNPLSNKWENFFTLLYDHIVKTGRRPYIVFLTATPINNTIWDLYWQLMLLVGMDKTAFIRENIPDLFDFFKRVDKMEDPSMLGDVLNEISIRRTRDYIIRNYPDATVYGKKIRFPKRELENVDYRLDDAYMGMYDEISDVITNKLKMPNYRLLQYKKEEKLTRTEEFDLGRMMALEGIFRTILLKRLESSIEAFRRSIRKHIIFLINIKKYMENGKLLTKKSFHKYLLVLLCHITDKSTAGGGMASNRLENKTNIKRLNGWLI